MNEIELGALLFDERLAIIAQAAEVFAETGAGDSLAVADFVGWCVQVRRDYVRSAYVKPPASSSSAPTV